MFRKASGDKPTNGACSKGAIERNAPAVSGAGSSMPASDDAAVSKPRSPFVVRSFGLSDPGQKRDSNEDCFVIAELARTLQVHHTNLPQSRTSLSAHRGYVFLIADGVGGNNAGEIASGLSVTTIEDFLLNTLKRFSNLQASEEQGALRALQEALCQADSRIFEETAKHPEWQGMGTTLTMAFAVNWRLFVAHAGDSRCYLYSGEKLQQLTQDHTMTAEMARRGMHFSGQGGWASVAACRDQHPRWNGAGSSSGIGQPRSPSRRRAAAMFRWSYGDGF